MDENFLGQNDFNLSHSRRRFNNGNINDRKNVIRFPLGFSKARRIRDYLSPVESLSDDDTTWVNPISGTRADTNDSETFPISDSNRNRSNPNYQTEDTNFSASQSSAKNKPKQPNRQQKEKGKKTKIQVPPVDRDDFKAYFTRLCHTDRTKKFVNPLIGKSSSETEPTENDWDDFESIWTKYKNVPCHDEQYKEVDKLYQKKRYTDVDGVILTDDQPKDYELLFTCGVHNEYPDNAYEWDKYIKFHLDNSAVGSKSHLQEYSRFELPLSLIDLENLTPMDYLQRYGNISELRQYVYEKHFRSIQQRDKNTQNLFCLVKDVQKCLFKILIDSFSNADFIFLKELLVLEDNQVLSQWEFFLVCAVTERLFFIKNTDAITNESYLVMAGNIEKVDFLNLKRRLEGVKLKEELIRLFNCFQEANDLNMKDFGLFDYSQSYHKTES